MKRPRTKHQTIGERAIALSAALTLTVAMMLAMTVSAARLYELFNGALPARANVVTEQITFVAASDRAWLSTTVPAHARRGTVAIPGIPLRTRTDAVGAAQDTRPVAQTMEDPSVDPTIPFRVVPPSHAPKPTSPSRFETFPRTPMTFSKAQMESVMVTLETGIARAPLLPPTPAQRDSMLRDQSLRGAMARDQGRPAAVAVAAGGFPFPLFSSGPSRAQRRRDSIIHAGNVKRLENLAALARARRDSLRFMDSIAMLQKP